MKLRLSTIGSLLLAAGAGFMLFQTSQNVQQAELRLRNTRAGLVKEQDSMRVLETEWDYLNRPDRLEQLARQYLKMQPAGPTSLVHTEADATKLAEPKPVPAHPDHKVVMAAQHVGGKPAPAPAPAQPAVSPVPPPDNDDTHQQFNTLLDSLQNPPAKGGE